MEPGSTDLDYSTGAAAAFRRCRLRTLRGDDGRMPAERAGTDRHFASFRTPGLARLGSLVATGDGRTIRSLRRIYGSVRQSGVGGPLRPSADQILYYHQRAQYVGAQYLSGYSVSRT